MNQHHRFLAVLALACFFSSALVAEELPRLPRNQWGAPLVTVSHASGNWMIEGRKNQVTLDESNLALAVTAGPVTWTLAPSSTDDLLVRSKGEEFELSLSAAGKIDITPYDTGAKTGVKIRLERFRQAGKPELDLAISLTVCLEGKAEDLVCEAVAIERETCVRRLDWPRPVNAKGVKYTALNHVRGNLLPGDWPKEYHPYRNVPSGQESLVASDKSVIQSNLIECWSMSWWGFQKGDSALVLIVETPDDAGYTFSHPPGGPTVIGPRWLASLGKLAYPRSARMCFLPNGNYVTMAKRYRRHVMDTGQFVSLKEKIAREPLVAQLIGTPHIRQHALRNYKPGAKRFDPKTPERNYNLLTFDELAKRLRDLKAQGIERACVTLAGWPYMGYDRQHPDVLPPSPAAGGWEGLKRWVETCKELGYLYTLHDQYRDYYIDAPSYDPQFATQEEDPASPPTAFPGTRFGGWKEGRIPFMDYWDGGKMAYLNMRFALAHLVKNYEAMFDQGIRMQGSYLDVFGYVPPTEDFNPEHPLTRTESMKYQAQCFRWVRNNLGIVGTEAGADWVVPYVDYSSDARAGGCIPAPLYTLVYHDAIMTPEGGTGDHLRCLLNGGFPTVGRDTANLSRVREIRKLHQRVALLEMTNHEFLDTNYRKERSTFADGTTVTIDRDAGTYDIAAQDKPTVERVADVLRRDILAQAAWATGQQPVTITNSSCQRSAGGKHDFYSEGDYWWPDPVHPDGPYIQRDGMTNPDNFVAHRQAMIRLSRIVGSLASAYKITRDEKYVRHAFLHLGAWFVNPATRMNPSLEYAQAIKGRATGRGIGIIDTIHLMEVAQGLRVMEKASAADTKVTSGTKDWFRQYLKWLTTHQYGQDEMKAKNNHGTCWVMQVASFARLTGDDELLNRCRDRFRTVLLPDQMAPDGSFPLELRRTKPFGYSLFNLDAMATICQILSDESYDLWDYQTTDGKSVRKAIAFLFPYVADKAKWPYPKDVMYWDDWPVAHPFLVFGAVRFDSADWFDAWKRLNHTPEVEEVLRNLPVRNPAIWME